MQIEDTLVFSIGDRQIRIASHEPKGYDWARSVIDKDSGAHVWVYCTNANNLKVGT